jgi:cell division protein FtsI/penicillin-binding protein 2
MNNSQVKQAKQIRFRIRLISACLLIFSCFLFVKLYSVQIVNSEEFSEQADRQYQRPANAFNRGTIYFSDKDGNMISAATIRTGFILAINPSVLQKNNTIEKVYEELSNILSKKDSSIPGTELSIELSYEDYIKKASKPNDTYEELKRNLDEGIGKQISELKLSGVSLHRDKRRYYPGSSLASHVLGFMAYNENELAGRYGLERSYERQLRRENDSVYSNFFVELFSNIKTITTGENVESDIVTTIDPHTQSYLENTLKDVLAKYSSEKTGGIIMNPKTGEIYAMAIAPSFDPNSFGQERNLAIFRNDLVESVYEMGSIIKPLSLAVGIDVGKINASSTYNDKGSVTSDGRTFYNFDKKGRGVITLQEALSKSLNTGFAHIVDMVGIKTFGEYFLNFRLGEKTGIDLPNEATGLVSNLKSPRKIEYYTASFGQGIALSPISVTRAFSVIANGGNLVQPYIVKKYQYKMGTSKTVTPTVGPRIIKEDTARQVIDMMVYNIDNALFEGKAKNPRYSVAGKTGTAQIAEKGGYAEDRFLHSFVGFLPASDPQFVVFLYTINPRGVRFSSETLAQPFLDTTKYLINYYQIPPDR